jgi:fermentation-respiration switch protein FrsA (DUF1100 family)
MKKILTLISLLLYSKGFATLKEKITFIHNGVTVNAQFDKPKQSKKRFKTILLCPGSGSIDRDMSIKFEGPTMHCLYPKLSDSLAKPFKEMADQFVKLGYAVLRYDKLEFTYGSKINDITFEKLWLPYKSAVQYLISRKDVDTNNIILIGHSESTYFLPLIAKQYHNVSKVVSLAGPKISFDTLLAKQIIQITQKCGGDTFLVNSQSRQILSYYSLVRSKNFNNQTPSLFGVSPLVWSDYLKNCDSSVYYYNNLKQKSLFIHFKDDLNVGIEEQLKLKNSLRTNFDFYTIPNCTHLLTGIDKPHVPMLLVETINLWLNK